MYGTISNSYATGTVSGRLIYVGGLVGYNHMEQFQTLMLLEM